MQAPFPLPSLAVATALLALVSAGLLSWRATGLVLPWLARRGVLDRPNERSLHVAPTPRGGGIGVMAGLLPVWATLLGIFAADAAAWLALAAAAALAALSFLDDRRGLSARLRFGAQGLALAAALALVPADLLTFQGALPLWADRALTLLAWLWFVNLYNFMDGIDGITGVETGAIGLGAALVAALAGDGLGCACGLALLGAALGFLPWNWRPAKIFMGDVGSIPLGLLIGWLLLRLATQGLWAAALILPAYYLADASLTLARRALRGEPVWRAHRQHLYQQAVQGGLTHDRVALMVLGCDAALILCAVAATLSSAAAALAAAAMIVALLLSLLAQAGRRRSQ